MNWNVAALYRFTPITDPQGLRSTLKAAFAPLGICGTLLIAPEGINGTLAGQGDAIAQMLDLLRAHIDIPDEDIKFSSAGDRPFDRLKIRLKREIITFDQPNTDPHRSAGLDVAAKNWNALIADPEVILLDTRNEYETSIGMFTNAQDPGIKHFTHFANYVRQNLDPARHKKIAMYCTGGIRCDKAAAFMCNEGFKEVYKLKGGILKYLEEVPPTESKWKGVCFVFDKRMALENGLKQSSGGPNATLRSANGKHL